MLYTVFFTGGGVHVKIIRGVDAPCWQEKGVARNMRNICRLLVLMFTSQGRCVSFWFQLNFKGVITSHRPKKTMNSCTTSKIAKQKEAEYWRKGPLRGIGGSRGSTDGYTRLLWSESTYILRKSGSLKSSKCNQFFKAVQVPALKVETKDDSWLFE